MPCLMSELHLLARLLPCVSLGISSPSQNARASFYVLMGCPGCTELHLPLKRAGPWKEITAVSFFQYIYTHKTQPLLTLCPEWVLQHARGLCPAVST